jgi:hypothetical protein
MTMIAVNQTIYRFILFVVFLIAFCSAKRCGAQGTTAFTYQGFLASSGTAANGNFDFTFTLFGASSGGTALDGPITNLDVNVLAGAFDLSLDFGANVFTGGALWLQIGVRTNGAGASFTTISPRQQMLPVPYALYAMTPAGPQGSAGPPGTNGSQGPTGPQGSVGPAGPTGPQGPAGAQGRPGTNGLSIVGPAGTNGTPGSPGDPGATGPTGPQGPPGPNGAPGPAGPTGTGGVPHMLVFDTNGVFVVPTGVSNIIFETWGGGGGGAAQIIPTMCLAAEAGAGSMRRIWCTRNRARQIQSWSEPVVLRDRPGAPAVRASCCFFQKATRLSLQAVVPMAVVVILMKIAIISRDLEVSEVPAQTIRHPTRLRARAELAAPPFSSMKIMVTVFLGATAELRHLVGRVEGSGDNHNRNVGQK